MPRSLSYLALDGLRDTIKHKAYELAQCDLKQLRYKVLGKTYYRTNDEYLLVRAAVASGRTEVVNIICKEFALYLGRDCQTCLHIACSNGHVDMVMMLVQRYTADVYGHDQYGRTALHVASWYGHGQLVETLVKEFHMDPMLTDDNGNTCLHHAAFSGKESIINLLINKCKCPVDCRNNDHQTPLHLACGNGQVTIARMLVSVYKADLKATDKVMDLPIHKAALGGHTATLCILISYGCPSDCKNGKKQTALHLACSNGHTDVVRMLLTTHKADITACDEHDSTPLDIAIRNGKDEVINCLTTYCDLDINAKYILHFACRQGYTNLVEILLNRQNNLNLLSLDNDGNSPLHVAAQSGQKAVISILIDTYSCPVDCRNNNKQTPLHMACIKGLSHFDIVTMLVEDHKTDLNACDEYGNTPLLVAAKHQPDELRVTKYLLRQPDCNPMTKAKDGSTILHIACYQGHFELVEELIINYKLDPLTGDNSGNNSLHYTALGGKQQVAAILITRYNSPVDQKNDQNETPLHLACSRGHLGFIESLVAQHSPNINALDKNSNTPLHTAALCGQTAVVNYLINKLHCDPKTTGFKGRNLLHLACLHDHDALALLLIDTYQLSIISADDEGNTSLHLAAMFGQKKCVHMLLKHVNAPVFVRNTSGKSVLDVAKDTMTKMIINDYLKQEDNRVRIQHDYKTLQDLSTKKYSGAQRLTRIFVMGNVESGKSTLIEAIKREGFFSSFNQVSETTVPPHTCGIIPSIHYSKTIGRVQFYDFAGDTEYYSSHAAIISNVLQSKHGTNICLILVNLEKDTKCILDELGYWFCFISYHSMNLEDTIKVLVLGSHVDRITETTATEKVEQVSNFIQKYLSHTTKAMLNITDKCLTLNCRNPRSSQHIRKELLQLVEGAIPYRLSTEASILLGLLEKDFKNVVTCTLQIVVNHIAETGICLPNTIKSLYAVVRELHIVGLVMLIETKSSKLEDSLLLLDVPKLTNEVHKLLFSNESSQRFISSTNPQSASMGILPVEYLCKFLPDYVTTDCLVQLQYCQELSRTEVKHDSVVPKENPSAPTLLYFPALCTIERKENITTQDCYHYSLSWYVKCTGEFDYLPPRFLHVLLLRLAYSFALPALHNHSQTASPNESSITTVEKYNYRCTMWKSGIHWLMQKGVECFVEMVNNSKGVIIITHSKEDQKSICTEMLIKIISEIEQAKDEFCATVTLQHYLMDSTDPASFVDKRKLFAVKDIHNVSEKDKVVISASACGNTQIDATRVAGLKNFIHYGKP